MEIGSRATEPAAFFDDVDRSYVIAQLEGAMEEPVELQLTARRSSPLLLPGASAGSETSEEARRAERLGRELAGLVPQVRFDVRDGDSDVPIFTVSSPAGARVRFIGVPRVNLFRILLETIRRASTRDHGLAPDWTRVLAALPADVGGLVFATPTCPSCPPVVLTAVRMALAADRMRVDVVDGIAGMDLVREWNVTGVPTVVLESRPGGGSIKHGRFLVEGPVPEETLLEFVRHAADPSYPAPAISSVPFRSCGRLEVG